MLCKCQNQTSIHVSNIICLHGQLVSIKFQFNRHKVQPLSSTQWYVNEAMLTLGALIHNSLVDHNIYCLKHGNRHLILNFSLDHFFLGVEICLNNFLFVCLLIERVIIVFSVTYFALYFLNVLLLYLYTCFSPMKYHTSHLCVFSQSGCFLDGKKLDKYIIICVSTSKTLVI